MRENHDELSIIKSNINKTKTIKLVFNVCLIVISIFALIVTRNLAIEIPVVLVVCFLSEAMIASELVKDNKPRLRMMGIDLETRDLIIYGAKKQRALELRSKSYLKSSLVFFVFSIVSSIISFVFYRIYFIPTFLVLLLILSIITYLFNRTSMYNDRVVTIDDMKNNENNIKYIEDNRLNLIDTKRKLSEDPFFSIAVESLDSLIVAIDSISKIVFDSERLKVSECSKSIIDVGAHSIMNARKLVSNDAGLSLLRTEDGINKLLNIYDPISVDIENLVNLALEAERRIITTSHNALVRETLSATLLANGDLIDNTTKRKVNEILEVVESIETDMDLPVEMKIALTDLKESMETYTFGQDLSIFVMKSEDAMRYLSKLMGMDIQSECLTDQVMIDIIDFSRSTVKTINAIDNRIKEQKAKSIEDEKLLEAKNLYDFL